jgi:D-lactate dehydrogenase
MPKHKPTICIYHSWNDFTDYTKKIFGKLSFTHYLEPLSPSNFNPETEILVVFVDSFVSANILEKLPKLRLIVTMSTGYDHIDQTAVKKRGILLANVPTYGENTVAEHTFALILGLTRKLFESIKRVKEGRYDFTGLRGTDLKEKTLGIIGTGHIGINVARIAQGFEMNVIAYDVKKNLKLAKKIGFTYATLTSLLKKSDIISLHAPLFSSTYHLINKKNINDIRQGSLLINTSRGGLVDPEALLSALNSGRLAGAGLDVLEDEHLLQDVEEVMHSHNKNRALHTSYINNLLIDHPKTIITPHNAFNSTEALQRIITTTVENISTFLAGKPQNIVF